MRDTSFDTLRAFFWMCPETCYIMLAIAESSAACIPALTSARVAPRFPPHVQYGDTPLHLAAKNGNTATAELLVKSGADVNSKNNVSTDCISVWAPPTPITASVP